MHNHYSNHWVNFSSLLSWLVCFLEFLIYYDNRWRLLLKQFICWIFTLDCLSVRLHCGLFQGCGAVVKMTQLWLRSSWFSWLRLHLRLLFVFTHKYFHCLGVPQDEWKCIKKVHKSKRTYQTLLSNLIWAFFANSAVAMSKSAKKQQSQVQTIQRRVTSRSVTRDNDNINNFWKGSLWFCRQCLRTFRYFLRPESRKWLFGKLYLCPSI